MKAIGKYQVIDEIGAGPAGATYRVRDAASEREFALKVLYSSDAASAELKDRFSRELAVYAELRHPHIAKMQDVGEADGSLYVATELLYGIDLKRHLEERRALPLEQKLELIAQVADALTVPHSRGIAHGNIKPGNIFIVAGKNAKILDFGSGKWLESVLAAGGKAPALMPNYLAPEQILGQSFDARSDLFAVALIFYQLLTGKYPYGVDPNLIPREIVHSEPEPLQKVDAGIPEQIERLVARALHKDPQQRLQSAAEFAAALNDLAQKLRDERTAAAQPPLAPAPVPPPPAAEKPALSIVTPAAKPAVVNPPGPLLPPAPPAPPAADATTILTVPPSASVPPRPAGKPALAAIKAAAQAPKKQVPSAKANLMRRRAIPIAIAGVLAVAIFGTLLSRQNSQASQNSNPALPPAPPAIVTPSAPVPAGPAPSPVQPVQAAQPQPTPAAPASPAVVEVKPSAELILRGRVRSLWESGKYAQAMALVDQILAENPDHAEARSWKKKIRAAQEAEAAIK